MLDRTGHTEKLRRMFLGNRISHAYMITGQGRKEFARQMAAALVCNSADRPCGRCGHCKKAAAEIHPDIQVISPEEDKKEISVDQVRKLRADAYVSPNEAGKKVYVIDPASELNGSAQNALLKVLEEGPSYAVFLLVSETAGLLLPTIRSRCEEVSLGGGEQEDVQPEEKAGQLARLLTRGKERELLSFCIELEKATREELCEIFRGTMLLLRRQLSEDPGCAVRVMPMIERLKALCEAAEYHTGTGHLLGWLCAASFSGK